MSRTVTHTNNTPVNGQQPTNSAASYQSSFANRSQSAKCITLQIQQPASLTTLYLTPKEAEQISFCLESAILDWQSDPRTPNQIIM
jgi:hypothetical protein